MRRVLLMLVCMVSFLVAPTFIFAATPIDTVQAKVDSVIQILREPALKGESFVETKKEKIWAVLDSIFDFSALSQRALGRNWNSMGAAEREEFVSVFRTLLGQVYLDKIMAFSDEKVVFLKETIHSESNAEVQTKLISGTKEIPIEYRLYRNKDGWAVYDVTIEGVSLVQNYRSQFSSFLTKKPIKELIASLRAKVGSR